MITMTVEQILERLIGFPSVVGTPNHEIVAWIADYLDQAGAKVTVLPGPEGDRSNLFATIGPADRPGYLLSGHMDVVAANEPGWESDPFHLRRDGTQLVGRGTSDMKGFLACALAALPSITGRPLAKPLHLAFSYDEEAGCRGVRHLIVRLPDLCATPEGCIIGEPSGLRAIRAHKGKAAVKIELGGRGGHSSRPDLGLNAIHAMADILDEAVRAAERLARGPFDNNFEPPYSSLQIGTIQGGQALNVIPEHCAIELEARAIAGVDPAGLLTSIEKRLEALKERGFAARWEAMSSYPALSLAADAPLALLMEELTGQTPLAAVSYGTEAGLYQAAGMDAIICGPGDIGRAHKANEFIEDDELSACVKMIEALGDRLIQ
ncbi:acetylornithine deacetylase [Agrobacterium rhizogenes]|uniref:Acetylornithine deacetylase protein n=3 Tax=Rhizobium rhizogenes TaxID=359 RepID=B9JK21_RHIR8|nr:acetylornithine deacetylase protein [Rhizobium rhizogenes K84]KAA6488464.1 acetylornithine deacetylase [Agrobacterium sp. ICMP 7243]MQB30918.1 acetylornithine deacetylase [Rhizobium rhizogenes]OCJ01928.1 acetylornithine deacetylase (ArgE) [Agrobacterium sp. 13-626]OCJ10536.1 acetylornithine deacetylase (ArgE) [Agrobacterium sp. B131/95]OCJ15379.1 acetylornithine deacetylase (ArgE) [Agrobacterium sp. B133/95]GAJ93258.1 putative acetylornithine deacetylase [Rhizobium rhizogenes NBRC 13257]